MTRAPRIELENIAKRFGDCIALAEASLTVEPGERLALVGENGAGKSSLMNVLYGLYQPDTGRIRIDGKPTKIATPAAALEQGIGMVHQHFTLVPTLTVAENVVLGHEPTRGPFIDRQRADEEVRATCQRFGFALDPRAPVHSLTVGSQQKVEIVKALHRGARVLVLDEPTAVLTPQEADELFSVARALSDDGVSVVLVSHKLNEVLRFATRVAVMRRGRKVAEVASSQTTADALAALMVGGTAPAAVSNTGRDAAADAPVLRLDRVSAGKLTDFSLALHAGEIVGIAGVDGNGQRELAEVVTGLRPLTSGTLALNGVVERHFTPHVARERGVAHVPEDRQQSALAMDLTVEENAALGRETHAPFARGPFIDFAGRRARATELVKAHDVRPTDVTLRTGALSGGNQQKLVVGRELDAKPALLVVVQPTRGLDIAAVAAVRRQLLVERDRGCAVLLISLDLDEVLALSDRVLVLFEGRLQLEVRRDAFDERALGKAMLGVSA